MINFWLIRHSAVSCFIASPIVIVHTVTNVNMKIYLLLEFVSSTTLPSGHQQHIIANNGKGSLSDQHKYYIYLL